MWEIEGNKYWEIQIGAGCIMGNKAEERTTGLKE